MTENSHEKAASEQIAEIVRDFMLLKTKFKAFLPGKLARVRYALDSISGETKADRVTNYHLFYLVSSLLYQERSLTMGEVSSSLVVPLSTATRMVDWLVDNGYAARLGDPEDRRIVRVALTESGRQTYQLAKAYIAQRVQQIFSALTTEEQQTLFPLLGKVARALKSMDA